jgi:DNA-binding beta-propeller fold protein YncE
MNSRTVSLGVALAMFAVTPSFAQMTIVNPVLAAKVGMPQFQVDPFFPKPLPNNWLLSQVSGLRFDKNNNLWVTHRAGALTPRELAADKGQARCCSKTPPVLVFDQSGNVIKSWGGPGQGYDWPKSEHGIFVDDNNFVWIGANDRTDGQILKFTMDGKFVMQIGKANINGFDSNATDRLGSPADIAVDTVGKEVYVADGYGNKRVIVFDSETGAYKRHWGAYGKKPSDEKMAAYDPAAAPSQQFSNPVHCVRFSKDGLLYVCDRSNARYQIFKKDGTFVSEHFFEKQTKLNGTVYELAFSSDPEQKFIYIVDGSNGEVRIVERASNEIIGRFGRVGRQAGEFTAVHNVAVDQAGNIYTAEVQTGQRIQKFRKLD